MKTLFKVILLFFTTCGLNAQPVDPVAVDIAHVPAEVINNFKTFIDIINGVSDREILSLFQPKINLGKVVGIPSEYPHNERERRDENSLYEIKKAYKLENSAYILVYGIKGTDVGAHTPTSLWVKVGDVWCLRNYGMSMMSLIQIINISEIAPK